MFGSLMEVWIGRYQSNPTELLGQFIYLQALKFKGDDFSFYTIFSQLWPIDKEKPRQSFKELHCQAGDWLHHNYTVKCGGYLNSNPTYPIYIPTTTQYWNKYIPTDPTPEFITNFTER